jgi:type II secretory pathway pseudopilin PulG
MSGSISRSWRRFTRRLGTTRAVLVIVGVVAVIAVVAVLALSGGSSSSNTATTATTAATSSSSAQALLDHASTAAPGVTATSIRVVFPVISLNTQAGKVGLAEDSEYGKQDAAIHTFVNEINDAGGIHGRKIDPDIVQFDPTDEAGMRALCKDWTEGSDPAFAVLDGLGTWEGDSQLCITQEGHTPMLAQWTTVTSYTQQAAPYLWWTGTDQSVLLSTLVSWGHQSGLLTTAHKVGILVGDRQSDQLALHTAVLPALQKLGITDPVVQTIAASPDAQSATMQAQAPLIVQQFRQAGVTSVIPLVPANSLFPYIGAETTQSYFPKLLLSDYESSIEIALGLIPVPYEKALDGQEGVTTFTLGGIDDDRAESQGGYDPGLRACYATWKAHNAPPAPPDSPYIEEQGPVAAWCQVIKLFAKAVEGAGPTLDRRTFVQSMARITNFPGTYTPTLSYSPTKYYGPVEYRVVKVHTNNPPTSACIQPKFTSTPQQTCWVVVQNWQPLTTGSP